MTTRMLNAAKDVFVWGRNTEPADLTGLEIARDELLATDLAATPMDELQRRLDALATGYATCRLASVPVTCFRARQDLDKLDPANPWTSVDELLAPKSEYVKAEGRFNRVGKPRLYVAESPNTALAEIKPKADNYAVVLMLRLRGTGLWLSQVGLEKLPTNDVYKAGMGEAFGGNVANPKLRRFLEKKGHLDRWKFQDEWLGKIAVGDGRYPLTNLIAQTLLTTNAVSGFCYPSVERDYEGLNIVMSVAEASKAFRCDEAWLVQLSKKPTFKSFQQTLPDEPVVIRRGTCRPDRSIDWGEPGYWPIHALHKQVAPRRALSEQVHL